MRRLLFLVPALLLAGCDLLASPGEEAVAAGSFRSAAAASRVARRCGVRDTRVRALGDRRAAVLMGHAHTDEAERCLRAWLRGNAGRFDPALLARVRAG